MDESVAKRLAEHLRTHLTDKDALAEIYSRAVASEHRWRLGTFFTPQSEAAWMVERWTEKHGSPKSAIDVGAGVGAFTGLMIDEWPESDVYAVDINPVTLGLLAVRAQFDAEDDPHRSERLHLVCEDYFTWIRKAWDGIGAGRLVIGNPPYTRLQLLPSDQRSKLLESAGGLCGARASLSALITAASLLRLGPDDGLCLLLPAHWLEADYAQGIRDWLWNAVDRSVEMHLFEASPFDARVDAVALLVGPVRPASSFLIGRRDHRSRFDESVGTLDRIKNQPPLQWRALFHPEQIPSSGASKPLSEYASVVRGVATGANKFFVLDDEQRGASGLPNNVLHPLALRLRHVEDTLDEAVFNAEGDPSLARRWLLVASTDDRKIQSVDDYLTAAEHAGVPDGYLCRQRRTWFDLRSEVHKPDVIIGPVSSAEFRFVENRAGAAITNNLYGLTWRSGNSSEEQRRRILEWLRSAEGQDVLRRSARTQGGGVKKLEPRALKDLPIPDSILAP
ncbi:hypothetical protein ACIGB8_10560 [Promicromonospora sukumoe]|uniref:hypothetical protein n=1 Tax=Promicromonospora sukumoe TaxID=88382 RepID=UPI0037CB8840